MSAVAPVCRSRPAMALAAALAVLTLPSSSAAQDEVTFTKDVAPILQRSCQDCHRTGSDCPDVAADLRGSAAVGSFDQGEGRHPRDAALVHRQEHRHSGLPV